MVLVHDDDVGQTLPLDAPCEALRVRMLPGARRAVITCSTPQLRVASLKPFILGEPSIEAGSLMQIAEKINWDDEYELSGSTTPDTPSGHLKRVANTR